MEFALSILGLLAIVAGIGAAYRVQEKRSRRLQADLANTDVPLVSAPQQTHRTVPSPESARAESARPKSVGPDAGIVETVAAATATIAADVPLAASLSVTDVVQPESVRPQLDRDAVPPELGVDLTDPVQPAVDRPSHTTSVVDEISRLNENGKTPSIAYLTQQANHSSQDVRRVVAVALGDLAARRQGQDIETIVAILGRLSHDSDLLVRLHAVEALGKVQAPAALPWLQQAQKQPHVEIVKAAATALQHLKPTPEPPAPVPQKPSPQADDR